jgi:hypothetical protein
MAASNTREGNKEKNKENIRIFFLGTGTIFDINLIFLS